MVCGVWLETFYKGPEAAAPGRAAIKNEGWRTRYYGVAGGAAGSESLPPFVNESLPERGGGLFFLFPAT